MGSGSEGCPVCAWPEQGMEHAQKGQSSHPRPILTSASWDEPPGPPCLCLFDTRFLKANMCRAGSLGLGDTAVGVPGPGQCNDIYGQDTQGFRTEAPS